MAAMPVVENRSDRRSQIASFF